MHGHQQSRRGHKYELQAPQADVRHRKEVIIADIFAAGLLRVACENSDAKDEKHRKPNLSQTGGVFVDTAQLGIECPPTHRGKEDPGADGVTGEVEREKER
uniref:Uncharacterized protein n=1 Tax=Sparus aurata TaxID=8175 RepID=A0A671UE55_SPAAU